MKIPPTPYLIGAMGGIALAGVMISVLSSSNGDKEESKAETIDNPSQPFTTGSSIFPGRREFDLLSEPIKPGDKVSTLGNVSWKGYRDCKMYMAAPIAESFPDSYLEDNRDGVLTGHGTNKGKESARFAAIVSCDTDEFGLQRGRTLGEWPPLIVDAGLEE